MVKDRVQFIIDHFPEWFLKSAGVSQIKDSTKHIRFQHGDFQFSSILFRHSGKKSGRSVTFYRVTMDEMAFMDWAKQIYNGNKTRSRFLNCFSTPPWGRGGFFYYLYSNALKLGVLRDKIHYSENPEKDAEWKARARRGMSDEDWQREQECMFVVSGRLVYAKFDSKKHVVSHQGFVLDPDWDYFTGTDFGYEHPFVTLWFARKRCGSFFRWYIFEEFYKSHVLLDKCAKAIHKVDGATRNGGDHEPWKLLRKYVTRVSDAAGARERAELAKLGIRTVPCKKGKDSVMTKINLVRRALADQIDGKPGLIVLDNCTATIYEFENYQNPETEEGGHAGKPIDKDDHSMDVIGDLLLTLTHEEAERKKGKMIIRR